MDYNKYLEYVREQPCCVCMKTPVDADHLETIGMGRDRKKRGPYDLSCIPLCREHHNHRHQYGTAKFFKIYRVDIWREAFDTLRRYILDERQNIFR